MNTFKNIIKKIVLITFIATISIFYAEAKDTESPRNIVTEYIKKIEEINSPNYEEFIVFHKKDFSVLSNAIREIKKDNFFLTQEEVYANYQKLGKAVLNINDDRFFHFIFSIFPDPFVKMFDTKNNFNASEFYPVFNSFSSEDKIKFNNKLNRAEWKTLFHTMIKMGKITAILLGGFTATYLTVSFVANLLQNISNNLMQPFFNRWGKHKNFLAKLNFEFIANYNLNNIAGYELLKNTFKEIAKELIEQKTQLSKIEGICLYGNPGNGKTQIIKGLAGEAGVPIVIVNLNTLMNENGQIEENINLLFEEARKKAPCIILLDEFDLITGSRKFGKLSDAEKSILNELLQQLDGTKPLDGVLVVANTNIIDNIDFALQRPGRLGRVIEVPAPNASDIKAIIKLYAKEYNLIIDEEAMEFIKNYLFTLPVLNVALIKNYLQKIKKYMKKIKSKKVTLDTLKAMNNLFTS